MRAAFIDLRTQLNLKTWELSAISRMQNVWITDSNSTVSALTSDSIGKIVDKRLAIEIQALRQNIWRKQGDSLGESGILDTLPKPEDCADIVRWCDTDVMLSDALTKRMDADKLMEAVESNRWSIAQPIESIMKKKLKKAHRKATHEKAKSRKERLVREEIDQQICDDSSENDGDRDIPYSETDGV